MSAIVKVLPKKFLSHLVGQIVHCRLPGPLRPWSIKTFGDFYNINFAEAEKDYQEYDSIGDFFIRRLRSGVRPISASFAVHPCDAVISQSGRIESGTLIQAKDRKYQLSEMVSEEKPEQGFYGGSFATYYLCPTDYHRVHVPFDCEIHQVKYLPGELWPVNSWSVNAIPKLFSINERVVIKVATKRGKAYIVFVGATNVGQMSMAFDAQLTDKIRTEKVSFSHHYQGNKSLKKGDELGCFHMGSTIVMVLDDQLSENVDFTKFSNRKVQIGSEWFK